MIRKDPREWPKTGGCTAPHIELYKAAKYLHEQLRYMVPDKLEKAQNNRKTNDNFNVSRVLYEPDVQALIQGVQIFSCLTIEASLNFYGVYRLGEAFYESNYERLYPAAKLTILLATCEGVFLEKNDEILLVLKRLVNGRNALVHPKSEEAPNGKPKLSKKALDRQKARMLKSAEKAFEDMNKYFELLINIVPEGRIIFSIH